MYPLGTTSQLSGPVAKLPNVCRSGWERTKKEWIEKADPPPQKKPVREGTEVATPDTSFGAEPNPPKHSTRSGCSSAEHEGAGGESLGEILLCAREGRDIECCFLSPLFLRVRDRCGKCFTFFCRLPLLLSIGIRNKKPQSPPSIPTTTAGGVSARPRMNVSIVRRPYFLFISLPSASRRPALVVALFLLLLLLLLLLGRNRPFSAPT